MCGYTIWFRSSGGARELKQQHRMAGTSPQTVVWMRRPGEGGRGPGLGHDGGASVRSSLLSLDSSLCHRAVGGLHGIPGAMIG